jgi:hypothetical protein
VPSTPKQVGRRQRVESLIGLAAPLLDLMLSVGERISKIVGREEEYYPIRSGGEEAFALPGAEPASDGGASAGAADDGAGGDSA